MLGGKKPDDVVGQGYGFPGAKIPGDGDDVIGVCDDIKFSF